MRDDATEVWSLTGWTLHLIDSGYASIPSIYRQTVRSHHGLVLGSHLKRLLILAVEQLLKEDTIGISLEDRIFGLGKVVRIRRLRVSTS